MLKTPAIAITEVGWTTYDATRDATHAFVGNYPPSTFAEQAERIVRMYLIARQAGAEFVCQYDFKDDGLARNSTEDNFGFLDYWGHPKPSYAAVAAMTRLVGHADPQGLVEGIDPVKARIYRFRRDDGTFVLAAWAVEGEETVDFKNPIPVANDLFGNAIEPPIRDGVLHLTGRPVYLFFEP